MLPSATRSTRESHILPKYLHATREPIRCQTCALICDNLLSSPPHFAPPTLGGRNAFSLYRFIDEDPELPAPDPELTPEPFQLSTAKPVSESKVEINSVNYGSSYPYDGSTFSGDGTYYGTTSNGNCAIRSPIPSMYDDMIPGKRSSIVS